MTFFDRAIRRMPLVVALLCAMAGGGVAYGQDEELVDDVIAPRPQPAGKAAPQIMPQMAGQFSPDQIDQWVFNRWGGADGAKGRLDANLALRIDDLDRACELTETQKKKITIAGLGDIKRYYDRVDDLKRRYGSGKNQGNVNNIWQEMQPLQVELTNGLFGDDSLFVKTVKRTLNADQMKRQDDLMSRREAARRRASIDLFVVQMEKALGLSASQRERLIGLLAKETPAPARYGQADYWYLMYQMTRLPESKLKEIFDAPQWRLLGRQFLQARGMEPWLKSNGVLAAVEGAADGPTRAMPMADFDMIIVSPRVKVRAVPVEKAAPGSGAVPKK